MTVPRRTGEPPAALPSHAPGVRTACMLGYSGEIQIAAAGRTAHACPCRKPHPALVGSGFSGAGHRGTILLVGLRLVYLIVSRLFGWLRLSLRPES
jgi:hypothetical protein